MKSLQNYIEDYQEQYITEMATIAKSVKLGKDSYRIAIHGASSKDREYPHIHIYLANDNSLKKFNFEISLVDILCNDESPGDDYVRKYIEQRGKNILAKYNKYFR